MSGMNLLWLVSVLVAFVAVTLPLLWILYRLHIRQQEALDRLQRDQNALLSEILARRTLEETGNVSFAGQMLAHSNAHDMRTEIPQVWTPPESQEPSQDQQVHQEQAVLLGDMDGLERPEEG